MLLLTLAALTRIRAWLETTAGHSPKGPGYSETILEEACTSHNIARVTEPLTEANRTRVKRGTAIPNALMGDPEGPLHLLVHFACATTWGAPLHFPVLCLLAAYFKIGITLYFDEDVRLRTTVLRPPLAVAPTHPGSSASVGIMYANEEFEAAAAFLGRTGDLAKRYPCPHPSGAGCPRNVLTEPDGSIRATCGSESKECDAVALLRDDIEVLRFDNASFVVALQQVFGISETSSNVEIDGDIAPVGTIRDSSGRRRPVVLLMPPSLEAAQALVAEMERTYPQGAILLTPTDEFVTPESEGRLDGIAFAWHTLSDLIVVDDRKLVATRGLECETRRADAVPQSGNLFRREQDTWLLSFAGKEVRIQHLVGLGYLAEALRSPRRKVRCRAASLQAPAPPGGRRREGCAFGHRRGSRAVARRSRGRRAEVPLPVRAAARRG